MAKLKYVIKPGFVTSQTDGQRHYISGMKLVDLYGVDLCECEIFEPAQWWPTSFWRIAEERHKGLIELRPSNDGIYELPASK